MEALAKLRTKFVEKVSPELVKQLLDDLLEDKIINSGEKNSIIEENPSTSDKARKLIDTVKNKGDKASKKLLNHLKERDETLYEELCESCGLTVRCATQESQEQQERH